MMRKWSAALSGLFMMVAVAMINAPAGSAAAADEPGFGWAQAPEARRHALVEEQQQLVPGWQAAPRRDQRVKTQELNGPRAFGLIVGDKVRLEFTIDVDSPYELQPSSLPPSRWLSSWLELQDVEVEEAARDAVNHYVIVVDYQIFATPSLVTLDVIPGFELRFAGANESFALEVPAWAFSISPMLKPEPTVEEIAEIPVRADAPPPLVAATLPALGTALFGVLSVLLGVYWLYANAIWPFRRRGTAPFARTCGRLRAVRRRAQDQEALHDGFRLLHQAFNQTAGEVVFAEHLDRFFAAKPAFVPRRTAIETFFDASRGLFFGDVRQRRADVDFRWLESLCRQCRAAELGAR